MEPALEHGHLAALLRHPLGQHGAGGARADDHHVGRDVIRVHLARRADVEGREWALGQLGQRAALIALGERYVSRFLCGSGVRVVADEGEVLGRDQDRLDEPAERAWQAPLGHIGEEAPLDEVDPPLGRHDRVGRAQPEHRVDPKRGERHLRLALRLGGERVEVIVDIGGDGDRGEGLVAPEHQHLGQGHQGSVLVRRQVLEFEPGPHRRVAAVDERRRHRDRKGDPDEEDHLGIGKAQPFRRVERARDVVRVVGRPREQERSDDQQVCADDDADRPHVPADVGCRDDAENGERAVLGHRVRNEGELGVVNEALQDVAERH